MNPFSLENRTILVTGASSGIGRSVAIECSKMDATVIVTGRNKSRLEETLSKMKNGNHFSLPASLDDEVELSDLVSKTPPVNGIVHCAGINNNIPFSFVNRVNLSELMNVNFLAPVLLTQKLLKAKKLVKGSSIVFISSVSGVWVSAPASSMYSASKGAINGIAKGMALDLAPKGIRVNCINPGVVETHIFDAGTISQEQLEANKKTYPLRRFGRPEEIAYAAVYLLSDAAAWTTGSNLLIDGGLTLT